MTLLIVLLAALPIVALAVYAVIYDIRQQTRWQPERIAYLQRVQERERRRPFDQAWAEWKAEVELRVMVELIVDDFQRRMDEILVRLARALAVADSADSRPSLEVVR